MSDDLRDVPRRAMLRGQILEGEPTTLIVTRQGVGRAGQVCLIGNGRIKTTVVLTSQEAEQLAGMLGDASNTWSTQGTALRDNYRDAEMIVPGSRAITPRPLAGRRS